VYGDLALVCEDRLKKGGYAIVDGELMNRSLPVGELVEVRAHEIIFLTLARAQSLESQDLKDQEQTNGQLDAPHRD
jgi:single-stranded DNA-binding protein